MLQVANCFTRQQDGAFICLTRQTIVAAKQAAFETWNAARGFVIGGACTMIVSVTKVVVKAVVMMHSSAGLDNC